MTLKYGLTFSDLYDSQGLQHLDQHFLDWLSSENEPLYALLKVIRLAPSGGGEKGEPLKAHPLKPEVFISGY